MLSHKTHNQLSALGYSALEHDNISEFRQSVAPELESMFNASGSAFFHWADSDNDPAKFEEQDLYFPHWDIFQKKQYLEQIRQNDPVLKWLYNGSFIRNNGVIRITSLVRPRDYLQSPLYQEFLRPLRTHYILTLAFSECHKLIGNVSLLRPLKANDFSPDEVELAKVAVPMLSAAYSRLIATEKLALYQSLTHMHENEQLQQAIYLLDINGHCLSQTNGAGTFNDYLKEHGICSIRELLLRTKRIKKHIQHCQLLFSSNKNVPPDSISEQLGISPGNVVSLNLQVTVNQSKQMVLMLNATSEAVNLVANTVQDKYNLSKRESEIVEYLRKGLSSNEIGLELNISQWTVKNHLHAIYNKVGVRNRTALVNKIIYRH